MGYRQVTKYEITCDVCGKLLYTTESPHPLDKLAVTINGKSFQLVFIDPEEKRTGSDDCGCPTILEACQSCREEAVRKLYDSH